jgi:uncharacterized protein YjbJ (UPF0337 family)
MSEHKGEELKGRLKETVGNVTGDKGLQIEGKLDQASAATKKKLDSAGEKIKGIVNPKP